MKTDPFDDAIRRKLEGINPPFQDKNWTQFQRFMGAQDFPPSLWQTPARWLQPALTAAAVAGMLITTIWQYRTNQSLTTHVQTLTQTVERMERAQLRLQQSVAMMASAPSHVDTVYLTGPGSPKAGLTPAWPPTATIDLPAPRPAPPNALGTVATGTSERQIPDRLPQVRNLPDRLSLSPAAENSRLRGQKAVDQPSVNPELNVSTYPATPGSSPTSPVVTSHHERVRSSLATNDPSASSPRSRTQPSNEETRYNPSVTNLPPTGSAPAINGSVAPGSSINVAAAQPTTGTVQPLTPLPLVTATDAFDVSWQRHLRRVRYRSPYATSAAGSLASATVAPTQRKDPMPVQFRVGIGGEAGTAQLGLGLYAEAIVANRWTIGTGLTSMSWLGDEYTNEQQFTAKTKRDFRYTYPGSAQPMPMGPSMPRQLVDISRSAQSLVVPVQLGYRLGVGSFTLTPAVGLNLALNARETATFATDRQPGFEDVRQSISAARPQTWYTNWTVGVGAERQWGQFAGQVSPVVYLPLQANSASLNTTSVGLRARLYYRF